ncbi:MazG nucleotide pyrophosphohydrolase domain-containing protein, partial [Porphyromonas loveana]|uniref:MazG nucleotide pyrophosphohydrolase domain-containing protein n=1 Tax=Porphyromonas loveana TaxID=1884669 RepID=UPI0035A05A3C
RSMPTLVKSYRMQEKAAGVGFDWEAREDVWPKVEEELSEVRSAIEEKDANAIEAEFGDLLFAVVNAARLYGVNPDNALERTNRKFDSRFSYVEQQAKAQGKALKDMTLSEMDALWNEAKQKGL